MAAIIPIKNYVKRSEVQSELDDWLDAYSELTLKYAEMVELKSRELLAESLKLSSNL